MSITTEDDFIRLIKQAEQDAENNPKTYTTKLALFAILGYVVILLVLFILIGLAGGIIATAFFSTGLFLLLLKKKLIFAVLLGIWVLMRALWVKFTPPEGYVLKRKDFPELFSEIDALSKQLKSLKIHEVILDRNLNAAVVQHPRLGVLGWQKNYLILGYQLLLTLSPEEMRSVLAHEFGHLSGNHSHFSGWIYRVRLTWLRVMQAFEQVESWGGSLMRKFFDWYSPHFQAYSFALARNNEYEADAIAAELTSPDTAVRALVNVYATAPYIDQSYWDSYFLYADENAKPPHAPFEGLVNFLSENPLARPDMLERIKNEMAVETHYADTHPSLKDRVTAIGGAPQVPTSPEISAAKAWLGKREQKIMQDFDDQWMNENSENWNNRYQYVSNAKNQLKVLSQKQLTELNDDELWDYAYWTREFDSDENALPLFSAYQKRHSNDPDSAFFIGNTLLKQNDVSGLEQLRIAMKSPNLIERIAHIGYNFLKEQGNDEEAESWWQTSLQQNEIFIAAENERNTVNFNDKLTQPKINDELLNQLINNLKQHKKVGKVWLTEKLVQHFPNDPVYIIAFTPKGFSLSASGLQSKIAETLDVDGHFFIVCKSGDMKKLAKKVIKSGKRIL